MAQATPNAAKKADKKPAPARPKAAPQKPQSLIYLGPSLADHSLRHGALFKGGPPSHIGSKEVLDLMIPVAGLPQAKQDLKNPASPLARQVARFQDPTRKEVKH
jgi:hypothetical protein